MSRVTSGNQSDHKITAFSIIATGDVFIASMSQNVSLPRIFIQSLFENLLRTEHDKQLSNGDCSQLSTGLTGSSLIKLGFGISRFKYLDRNESHLVIY